MTRHRRPRRYPVEFREQAMRMVFEAEQHRVGVEQIRGTLQFAPFTYWSTKRRPLSARSLRDKGLKVDIARVHVDNFWVYGANKVWAQLNREGSGVARCSVERLMRALRLGGAVRSLQDRTGSKQGPVAGYRRPRTRHPRVGRLVQPPPPLR